jgi:tRNA threonylcarbamoyladenosine biosynthesis protein TsaB
MGRPGPRAGAAGRGRPVIVLGLESATAQVGCALGDDEGLVASFHLARGRRHAESLAPAVEHLCLQSGIGLDQVGAIAVDIGPGLFTGLRVGVATGKALAAALALPMVGLSSLDVLAHPHRRERGLVASVVDARRGEVFWALYRPVPGGGGLERITEYAVGAPSDLAVHLRSRGADILAVGDGAWRYRELLGDGDHVAVAPASCAHPSASVLVELALPLAREGRHVTPDQVVPLYLRPADVRISWRQRGDPVGAAGPLREAG